MGMFLAMSGVIGKSCEEVVASLRKYSQSVGGGLETAALAADDENCCIVEAANGNISVVYPNGYIEWDDSTAFISQDLKTPAFSFHIHDGDLWMYVLYVDGQVVNQFNPIPDYWDDKISQDERESWKGDAETVAKYIPGLNPQDISKYLVSWQFDNEESIKAYPSDEYPQEDWQLLDFMRKLKLPYPLDNDLKSKGQTFLFWTKQLKLQTPKVKPVEAPDRAETPKTQKPWWKIW